MEIDRLSSGDRLMLRAGARWPQHIGALVVLDGTDLFDPAGRFRVEAIRAAVEARLDRVPRFRRVLRTPRRGLGPPFWTDAARFDVTDHVRVVAVPAPGGEPELLDVVERLRRRPLDLRRPPWEMWFLTGLPDCEVGLFVRIHHAAADGVAALVALSAFLDAPSSGASGRPATRWRPISPPSTGTLYLDNLRRKADELRTIGRAAIHPVATAHEIARAVPAMWEVLGERPASRTSLERFVGRDRRIALVRASATDVRRIGRLCRATPNDVLLALTAGGVRALLASRGEAVEDATIRVYVPVSLRRGRAKQSPAARGNAVAQMAVPIALTGEDPVAGLRRIAAETGRRKRRPRTSLGLWFASDVITGLLLRAVARQRVNITTANLPGPRDAQRLLGMRVLAVYPVVPLIANVSLGVGAVSYAGSLDIGITADRDAFPDLEKLVAGMEAELGALCSAAGGAWLAAGRRATARPRGLVPVVPSRGAAARGP